MTIEESLRRYVYWRRSARYALKKYCETGNEAWLGFHRLNIYSALKYMCEARRLKIQRLITPQA